MRHTDAVTPYRRGRGFYADLRRYADVGGKQEALKPPGAARATSDPAIAAQLLADRIRELEASRRDRSLHGLRRRVTLTAYAAEHLRKKAESGKIGRTWIACHQTFLERAVEFFGASRSLHSIRVADCQQWAAHLATVRSSRGLLSGGTVRHHLNALSNLYKRAISEEVVPPGYNPVAAMMEKPTARRQEARWLEVPDAALLLEAARTLGPSGNGRDGYAYPLLATFLLTGGRQREVLGLEAEDISFDRQTVTFRPNRHRRLKNATSARVVPLWPQLAAILRPYMMPADRTPRSGLLFRGLESETMLHDVRKLLDRIAGRVGYQPGEIRSKMFRHTYCAARLQTLDQGAPVSVFTVAREMGHGGDSMVRRVYGHLGTVRHRAEVVEYRIEQHAPIAGAPAGGYVPHPEHL